MTSLPTATIPGHTTQLAGSSEPGHLVGQRTRRLSQSAADALIDDLLAVAVFLLQALPHFPAGRLDEEGQLVRPGFSRRPALVPHGVGGARLACERSRPLCHRQPAVPQVRRGPIEDHWHEAISPDRQLCWLWRSLLVA